MPHCFFALHYNKSRAPSTLIIVLSFMLPKPALVVVSTMRESLGRRGWILISAAAPARMTQPGPRLAWGLTQADGWTRAGKGARVARSSRTARRRAAQSPMATATPVYWDSMATRASRLPTMGQGK